MLDKIIENKKKEVAQRKLSSEYIQDLRETVNKNIFKNALLSPGVSLIAEVKKASPSRGVFVEDFDSEQIALSYEKAGAAAVSVLTEKKFFQGGPDDLKRVKKAVKLPILCKDFIVDPFQIYEAKYLGADAVLLIVAVLEPSQLKKYIILCNELGLDAVVEVHSREEIETALESGAEIIGINNRDLKTFKTDIVTTLKLADFVPEECILISESGIFTSIDVRMLSDAGVDAVLVGEALVTSDSIECKVKELLRGQLL